MKPNIATILLALMCCSCATDYVRTPGGAKLVLGQVGGIKAVESITVGEGVDRITITGYAVDNRESYKDTTRAINAIMLAQYALAGLKAQEGTTRAIDANRSREAVNASNNATKTSINASNNAIKEVELLAR